MLNSILIVGGYMKGTNKTRMVVHRQLVEPAVCLSELYDVY